MNEDRTHIVDELAGYVVDGLHRDDAARVDAHLATCTSCAAALRECRAVIGMLPLALDPVPPPARAWTTIRSRARARRTRRWPRAASWSAIAACAVGLLLWNVSLQRELGRYAEGPQVEKLARRPARLVVLAGVGEPQASARLFAAVDGRSGHMAVSGLAPLPSGRIYQLWFVRHSGAAASAATFNVDADRRAWVVINVPGPLDDMRAILVTEEPAGGAAAPTGPSLLEAREWH